LVEAILRVLEAPAEKVQGEIFTVSDNDALTWAEFFGYFAERIGKKVRTAPAAQPTRRALNPFRLPWAWCRAFAQVAISAESKPLLKKALTTDPPGRLPRALLERFPGIEHGLRRWLSMDSPEVYVRPGPSQASGLVRISPRFGCISCKKARQVLGY